METIAKKLRLDNIRVMINDGLSRPVLQCSTEDFKKIVGDDIYDDLKIEEQILQFGRKKKENEGLIDKLKGEVESLGAKISELTGKQKDKGKSNV